MSSDNQRFESIFTEKVRAGKRRTYFFDVRKTKKEDFYVTITESTKKFDSDGYERHKIFLYKEDFNRFVESLQNTINHIKNDLLPDYDYDEFTKKQEEWEQKRLEEEANGEADATSTESTEAVIEKTSSEDDMSW